MLTSVELDHHDAFGSLRELEDVYRAFLAGGAAGGDLGSPGAARAARRAARRLRRAGVDADRGRLALRAATASRSSCGSRRAQRAQRRRGAQRRRARRRRRRATPRAASRRFARRRAALRAARAHARRGAEVYDDYAHHPTEIAATLAAARTLAPARLVAVFQPHLYSRTRALAREFGVGARRPPTRSSCSTSTRRASAPADFPGVSGLLRRRGDGRRRAGQADLLAARPRARPPRVVGALARRRRRSSLVMGAGDVDALGRELVAERTMVEPLPDYPLARLTTVRTGGAAERFARAGSRRELIELLALGARARARAST